MWQTFCNSGAAKSEVFRMLIALAVSRNKFHCFQRCQQIKFVSRYEFSWVQCEFYPQKGGYIWETYMNSDSRKRIFIELIMLAALKKGILFMDHPLCSVSKTKQRTQVMFVNSLCIFVFLLQVKADPLEAKKRADSGKPQLIRSIEIINLYNKSLDDNHIVSWNHKFINVLHRVFSATSCAIVICAACCEKSSGQNSY